MNKVLALTVVLLLLPAATNSAGAPGRPTVVELFTSEGCSSCPPADALLAELAQRPEVLALSFHVDYWDRLGWKDPASSAAATVRQRHYAELLHTGEVYTPQIVIDGGWQGVGSERGEVERAIGAARRRATDLPVHLAAAQDRVRVEIGAGAGEETGVVELIGFDRRRVDEVRGGENDGRTLSHVDVVRGVAEIGRFAGRATTITAPVGWHADRLAVLIEAADGHILGVAVTDAASN
jgi:hypothetical protein